MMGDPCISQHSGHAYPCTNGEGLFITDADKRLSTSLPFPFSHLFQILSDASPPKHTHTHTHTHTHIHTHTHTHTHSPTHTCTFICTQIFICNKTLTLTWFWEGSNTRHRSRQMSQKIAKQRQSSAAWRRKMCIK